MNLNVKFFSEPPKWGRSGKTALESLDWKGFQIPRVRTIASIRED